MEINVVQKVMKVNDELAALARKRMGAAGVLCVNIMSAPGSGKTSLLEASLPRLRGSLRVGVIEGDPDTTLDAERIARCDVPVVQIQTAGGCHLEANLVNQALEGLGIEALDVVLIENVGNLVCPVEFDLGESQRVALVSTAEGDDKPAKYPKLFRTANLVVLNKTDLLPYVSFDKEKFLGYIAKLNPGVPVLEVSCTTGAGIAEWCDWLRGAAAALKSAGVNP